MRQIDRQKEIEGERTGGKREIIKRDNGMRETGGRRKKERNRQTDRIRDRDTETFPPFGHQRREKEKERRREEGKATEREKETVRPWPLALACLVSLVFGSV